jgi:hypothetical protein
MKINFITGLLAVCLGGLTILAAEPATNFVPQNPPAMAPLAGRDTPAFRAAKLFLHGVNLGNYLEVPPGQNWGVTVAADEFAAMKREGFDHVRVPVGWHHYTGAGAGFHTDAGDFFTRGFCGDQRAGKRPGGHHQYSSFR